MVAIMPPISWHSAILVFHTSVQCSWSPASNRVETVDQRDSTADTEPLTSSSNSMVQETRASTRVSIAFDGETPYEDTDTLVLTFSCLRSLDLRVSRDDPSKLDWATASSVTELAGGDPGEGVCSRH